MRGTLRRVSAGTILAIFIVAANPPAHGENVPLHTVPKPVRDAVRIRFKDARLAGAERERGAGGYVYEITIKHQGHNMDVILTADGAIRLIKREIAATELPEPVAKALADAYPDATPQTVEAVITVQGPEEKLAYYEMDLVTAQRRLIEARVSTDGRILQGSK